MRLLQSKEREVAYKKELDFAKKQRAELSQEVISLLKSFNLTKANLENFYAKESALAEKEKKLNFREENLTIREDNVKLKEKEVLQLKEDCNLILEKAIKLEQGLVERAKATTDREIEFKSFRSLQESLLARNKQKLRDWLEKERNKNKLKICPENLQE